MPVAPILADLEATLVQTAEARLAGNLLPAIAEAAVQGCLLQLPMPAAPMHIPVLAALLKWKESALITPAVHQVLHDRVTAAARPKAAALPPPPPGAAAANAPTGAASKKQKVEHGQKTLQNMGMKQFFTSADELRRQRQAAALKEDYTPVDIDLGTNGSFPSARDDAEPKRAPGEREYRCPKCPKIFDTGVGLRNHAKSHDDNVRPKTFYCPPPPPKVSVELVFGEDELTCVAVDFLLNGLTVEEHEAAATAAAAAAADAAAASEALQAERAQRLATERLARERKREREAAAEMEVGDGRRGSTTRQRYTPTKKLKILDTFDEVMRDPTLGNKVVAFEMHNGSMGARYNLVSKWAAPLVRATISTAAGKDHRKTLLAIDKSPRAVGKYGAMEKELYRRFQERRAKARKVSPRWLSAMALIITKEIYTAEECNKFKASPTWRERFAKRFRITIRRKTNCKKTTWAETKPVLQTYFRALRRRLQPSAPATTPTLAEDASSPELEPEPEDAAAEWEDETHTTGGEFADESDDEGDDDAVLHPFLLPEGFKVAPPPTAEQLTFRNSAGAQLVGRSVLFRWPAVGWCLGKITEANTDARRKINGVNCNFYVYYDIDKDTSKHNLALDSYGEDDGWVLLEPL